MKHCLFCSLLLFMNVMFLLIQQQQPPQQQKVVFLKSPSPVPERSFPRPILSTNREMVGYLTDESGLLLPLYARPSPTHRHRYNYHTENTNSNNSPGLRLPIFHNKRNCTENLGCDELYEGTRVDVPGIEQPLVVKLYSKDFYF